MISTETRYTIYEIMLFQNASVCKEQLSMDFRRIWFVIVVVKNMEKYIESIPSIEQVCSVLQIAIKVDDGWQQQKSFSKTTVKHHVLVIITILYRLYQVLCYHMLKE